MPYSQILALIVAISIIVGAPDTLPSSLSPWQILSLWSVKAFFWYCLCLVLSKKRPAISERVMADRVLWFANILLFPDLFVFNGKWFFPHPPIPILSDTFIELIGLFLYFLYVVIGWSAIWRGSIEARQRFPSLDTFAFEKARMVLPVLVPYFIAGIIGDLFKATGLPYPEFFFTGTFILSMAIILPPVTCRIWGCTPLPPSPIRDDITAFLNESGQKIREIMLWPAEGLGICTAAVLGMISRFRYILLTPCLLAYLTVDEIRAVLSHEMAHIKRHHMLWYLVFLLSYGIVMYRLVDPLWTWMLTREDFMRLMLTSSNDALLTGLLAVIPFTLTFILYFRFVIGYFMRNFEREADASIFDTEGQPFHLINALEKVAYLAGGIRDNPNWHHFSVAERVEFLRNAFFDKTVLARFRRRLNVSKVSFVAAAILFASLPALFPKALWKTQAKETFSVLFLEQLIKRGEVRPDMYEALGDYFLNKKDYERAETFLKKALKVDPLNPECLNNLAWLYATSEDPRFFRPKDALILAQKASKLSKKPFILDTLAEAYFKNGGIKEAILLEKQILSMNPPQKQYYERQLRRFMSALKGAAAQGNTVNPR